jgi:hypothetical protein
VLPHAAQVLADQLRRYLPASSLSRQNSRGVPSGAGAPPANGDAGSKKAN